MAMDNVAKQIKEKAAVRKGLALANISRLKIWAIKSKKAMAARKPKKTDPKKRREERLNRKAEMLKNRDADAQLTAEEKESEQKELAVHREQLVSKGIKDDKELDKLLSQRKVTIRKRRKRHQRRQARKARGDRGHKKREPVFKKTFGWNIPDQIVEELMDQEPLLKKLRAIEAALSAYVEANKNKKREDADVVDSVDQATPLEGELVAIPDADLDKGLAARLQLARSLAARLGFKVQDVEVSGSSMAGPLAICCASKLPFNEYVGNRFRNSIHFNDKKRVLYIRPQRLNTVGELVVVTAHSLSHILAGDMGNDGSSLFQARFFAALKVFAKHMRDEGRNQALATASKAPQEETNQYSTARLDARVDKYESAVRKIPVATPIPNNHKQAALKRAFDREDAAKQAWAADTHTMKVLQNNVKRLRSAIDRAEEDNDTFVAMVMTGQLDIEMAKLEAAMASQNVYNLTFGSVKTGLDVIATPRR